MLFTKYFLTNKKEIEKIPSLLVGLPHTTFSYLLDELSGAELKRLSTICLTEPLQHQLSLFIHENQCYIDDMESRCLQKQVDITLLQPEIMTQSDARTFLREIDSLTVETAILSKKTDKALILAWSSNRTDLISTLTRHKEAFVRLQNHCIGHKTVPVSGLFALFFEKLFFLYGDSETIDSARDDEPALEGLSRFSLWDIEDYELAGLLPPSKKKIPLSSEQKAKLLDIVQKKLETRGLNTVKDLKEALIFSEPSLIEFLGQACS